MQTKTSSLSHLLLPPILRLHNHHSQINVSAGRITIKQLLSQALGAENCWFKAMNKDVIYEVVKIAFISGTRSILAQTWASLFMLRLKRWKLPKSSFYPVEKPENRRKEKIRVNILSLVCHIPRFEVWHCLSNQGSIQASQKVDNGEWR